MVKQEYGGFAGLAAEWEERHRVDNRFPRPRQESTIHRWTLSGIPTKKSAANQSDDMQLFGLSALLDIDPLALFDFERNGYFSRFNKIRQMIFAGFGSSSVLSPLIALYGPRDPWPNELIMNTCFNRNWHCEVFNNGGNWNHTNYALVKTQFSTDTFTRPRTVHIAYRRLRSRDTLWRFYGSVMAIENELRLYSESGDFQTMRQANENEIRFRTYFGGRPVEWRIASLHPFSLENEVPFDDKQTIGFEW